MNRIMHDLIDYVKTQAGGVTVGLKSGITFTGHIIENPKILYGREFITIQSSIDEFKTIIPKSEIEYIIYGDENDE